MEVSTKGNNDNNQTENKNQSLLDLEFFFCKLCLQYPEYIININQNGKISISHKCLNNETTLIKIEFQINLANAVKKRLLTSV